MDKQMYDELVQGILAVLDGRVIRIVLYGSQARGTATEASDVDIAIFVPERLNRIADDKLSDVIVEMNLKYDKVFAVIDIDEAVYEKWKAVTPFYQNVDREGIVLWTAA